MRLCPLTYDHFLPFEPKHHLTWPQFRRIVDQIPQIERAVLMASASRCSTRTCRASSRTSRSAGACCSIPTRCRWTSGAGMCAGRGGLDELRISLDAATPASTTSCGIDKFNLIVANLRAFVARHGGGERPRVSLWFVGMQENLHELPDFVRLAAELGVPEVYLQRLVYFGGGEKLDDGTTMVPEQSLFGTLEQRQARLIEECEALATSLGLTFRASGATTPHESVAVKGAHPWQGCYRPWALMYITATGTALPCCIAPFATTDYQQIMLGNVFERPLAEGLERSALSGAARGGAGRAPGALALPALWGALEPVGR